MNFPRISKSFVFCVSYILIGTNTFGFAQSSEFRLKNGIHVVVIPMPQSNVVAMETAYEVGFADEPKGMVQASHLLEHLVCFGPGAGFKTKQAFQWLNNVGMSNAETLPGWTHYDYIVPAEHFERVLEIEASRLSQESFDINLLRAEAKRVYRETDMVERNPRTGMAKHAFMAIFHALRHQSKSAKVRGGLEEFDESKLLEFYQRFYQPKNMTIVIVGRTTQPAAKKLIEKHFGSMENRNVNFDSKLNWERCPKRQVVRVDANLNAVCTVWRPPANATDRTVISLLSMLAYQKLATDPAVLKTCHMSMCSNNIWPVGDLPVFAYASAKSADSLVETEHLVRDTFESQLRKLAKNGPRPLIQILTQITKSSTSDWKTVQFQTKQLERLGRSADQARKMILGQTALNHLMWRRLLNHDPKSVVGDIENLSTKDVMKIVEQTLNLRNRRVVIIKPMNPE